MLSRFSIRKPYTVFVAVVVAIILGVVSFLNMTPDLLPNMDFPYVIIVTTYPGAVPEEVEKTVTKPLEQKMATLDNIENVSSTSSENYSMLMLEFSGDSDMSSVSVDIIEGIDSISGQWNDMVGTPIVIKINPNMLALRAEAVNMSGMDQEEISKFVNEELLYQLEGIEGVASVSTTGLFKKEIAVELSEEKIALLNMKIKNAVDTQFVGAQEGLDDAKNQLDSGISQAESGRSEIQSGYDSIDQAYQQGLTAIQAAKSELTEKERDLEEASLQIDIALALAQTKLDLLIQTQNRLVELSNSLDGSVSRENAIKNELDALSAINDALIKAQTEKSSMEQSQMIAAGQSKEEAQAELKANSPEYNALLDQIANLCAQAQSLGYDPDSFAAEIAQLEAEYNAAKAYSAEIKKIIKEMGVDETNLEAAILEKKAEITLTSEAITSLEESKRALAAGWITIDEAYNEIDKQSMTLSNEITKGIATLVSTESVLNLTMSQLEEAKNEIEGSQKQVDSAKEDAYKKADLENMLTLSTVSQILYAQNFAMPAGYITDGEDQVLVRIGDELLNIEELKELVIFNLNMPGIEPIHLSDVADIKFVDNSEKIYAKINGGNSVLLSFSKQSGYATAIVSENIEKKFNELSDKYEGLSFTSLMDQGDYINIVISSVMNNLLIGALLAIVILFIFLRDIRPTFIVACSVPISLLFAIVCMYFSGVTLNIISMSGLAVGVGMLVDNSIVVVENIYRLRKSGLSITKASLSGAAQVAAAITSSTLTTVCVFFPIVFIDGITKQLFTDMALTIAFSLLASLLVAITLVPAMSLGALKKTSSKENKLWNNTVVLYKNFLNFVLNKKIAALALVVFLLVGSFILVLQRGFIFIPDSEGTEISVSISLPEDTTYEESTSVADEISERIYQLDGVETVGTMFSTGIGSIVGLSFGEMEETSFTMYVILDEKADVKSSTIVEKINEIALDYKNCSISASNTSSMSNYTSILGGSGISLKVYSNNLDLLRENAQLIAQELEKVEGVSEVDSGITNPDRELRISVDKEKAMESGLTVAQVYSEIAAAITTESAATSLNETNDSYDVKVVSKKAENISLNDIINHKFTVTSQIDGSEKQVLLSDIAKIEETQALSSISRESQRRYLAVSAQIAEGYNVAHVTEDAKDLIAKMELPGEVTYEFSGENEMIMAAMEDLFLLLLLGIVLVYLIMVAQFQSFLSPFIVMFTIPLAFTGGFIALLLAKMEISIVAMVGIILLVGVVVNNGIVLVDYINQLRAEGVELREAINQACTTRLRPVLMTALTTILALVPLALGLGTGAELMQPLAVVSVGGLVYATFMTLFIVPIMYLVLAKKKVYNVKEEDLEISEL